MEYGNVWQTKKRDTKNFAIERSLLNIKKLIVNFSFALFAKSSLFPNFQSINESIKEKFQYKHATRLSLPHCIATITIEYDIQ